MASKKAIGISVAVIVVIAGSVVGGMAYAASQLEAGDMTIERLYMEDSTWKVDLQINMTNPTIIPVSAGGLSYSLYIEDEFVGTGEVGKINIPSGSALIDITQNIEDISSALLLKLSTAVLGNEDITIKIEFKSIKVIGISIPFEYTLTEVFSAS